MNKELADLYGDCSIGSFSRTTATGPSRLLDGATTHDRTANFPAESDFASKELWLPAKKDVRKIESPEGVVVFDDTIREKPYADENGIVSYRWDHAENRSVKGVDLWNCLYRSRDNGFPIGFDTVRKEESSVDSGDGREKRRSTVSKNERFRNRSKRVRRNRIAYRYVPTDIRFASGESTTFVKTKLKRDFTMAFESDRPVALSKEDGLRGRFVGIESPSMEEDRSLRVCVEGVVFPVLPTKRVFTNRDCSEGTLHPVCGALELDDGQIRTIYRKRWKVEEFHKSTESNTGLAKSPTRSVRTRTDRLFASICAYVELERLRISGQTNRFALKSRLYMNAPKAAFQELKQMKIAVA